MNNPERPNEGDENTGDEDDEAGELFQAFADAVNRGDIEEAEAASLRAWQHIAEAQDDEPSPWLQAMEEAHRCEAAFDWTGAEEAYKRAVQVTAGQPLLQSKAHGSLSALYRLVDLDVLALEAAQAATKAALQDNISSITSFALQAEAALYLKARNLPAAWGLINQAFEAMEEGPLHNLERTYALVLRADYFIEDGAPTKVQDDLATAWSLLEPWAQMLYAGGWQGGLALWWAATARLRASQGDRPGAAAWREAVTRRRIIAQLPQLEGPYKHNSLAVALRDLGRSLREMADPLAAEAFKESRSIRRTIGLPPLDE